MRLHPATQACFVASLPALVGVGLLGALSPPAATLGARDASLVTSWRVAVYLGELGIEPASLAAAGVAPAQATLIVQAATSAAAASLPGLAENDAALADAWAKLADLDSVVLSGVATPLQLSDREQAKLQVQSLRSHRATLLGPVAQSVAEQLAIGQKEAIIAIRTNRHWSVPIEHAVVDRGPKAWCLLQDAVSHVRVAERLGLVPSPEHVDIVSQAKADPKAAAAGVGLKNLAAIEQIWGQAFAG